MPGLTWNTAHVTAAEVAELTHEDGLDRLNGSSATIDNACKWATNAVIDKLDGRGIPVAMIANTNQLKRPVAYMAAHLALKGGMPGDDPAQKRAQDYLETSLGLLGEYRFVSSDSSAQAQTNLMLPTVGNMDARGRFSTPGQFDARPVSPWAPTVGDGICDPAP